MMDAPLADHDLLVRLDTKVDVLTQSFNDFHATLATRVLKAESRLDQIDIYHAAIPLSDYQDAAKWVNRFRANLNLIVTLGGIIIATLGGIIGSLVEKYFKL